MANCNGALTPMEVSSDQQSMVTRTTATNDVNIPYRSAIGSLMYLSVCTRPDITFAVNKLARYVSNFTIEHWNCVKRIIRYLKGTKNYGLTYGRGDSILRGYADASFADPNEQRKSTTGFLFLHGSNLISWASYVQPSVTRSTSEAEYLSLADAAQEATWLRRLLSEMGNVQKLPTVIYEDNIGAIYMAQGAGNKRVKHIDVKYHFLRETVRDGKVKLVHLPTKLMIADTLTKSLPRDAFNVFRNAMGVNETTVIG